MKRFSRHRPPSPGVLRPDYPLADGWGTTGHRLPLRHASPRAPDGDASERACRRPASRRKLASRLPRSPLGHGRPGIGKGRHNAHESECVRAAINEETRGHAGAGTQTRRVRTRSTSPAVRLWYGRAAGGATVGRCAQDRPTPMARRPHGGVLVVAGDDHAALVVDAASGDP